MHQTTTKSHTRTNFLAFQEAQESLVKIITLKPFLSSKEEETLALLMDKKFMNHLGKSMREAQHGKVEPLGNILK